MKLASNIDAKGKAARLIWGLATLVAGLLTLVFWAIPTGGWAAWAISIALLASGAFGVFEARTGWCAVRAMGFKTRF
jgi:VIT1/CCC1 family predicted Fe2+/Mn2+ transporter